MSPSFNAVVAFIFLFLSMPGASQAVEQALPSDFEIFQSCIAAPSSGQCANADFNLDGVINLSDFVLLRSAVRGDFNHDGIVDLGPTPDNEDLNYLNACVAQVDQSGCESADLNNDGVIDHLDLDHFQHFEIFDLNQNNTLEFPVNYIPEFEYLGDRELREKETLKFYVWVNSKLVNGITYAVDNAPPGSTLTPVVMGDFNNDGAVDDFDLALITMSVDNGFAQQYDLNNDGLADEADIAILQDLMGSMIQGLLFSWRPGRKDSGFYDISVVASADNGMARQKTIKLTVYDLDVLNNYYAYDDVLVIINDQSRISREIGRYFAQNRNIPNKRIIHISTPENETISREQFEIDIRAPIEEILMGRKFDSEINYIVTTKGVPLRIAAGTDEASNASVDSELTLIGGDFTDAIGTPNTVRNPYHKFNYPFSSEMFGIFLVTRLTAYTLEDVISLIDRSRQAKQYGTFVFDVDPAKDNQAGFSIGNQWLRNAAALLIEAGQSVYLDETAAFVTGQTHVLGYASWGSNDSYDTNHAKTGFHWLPGSIAETFVSTSARTFNAPASYGQSLIADLIAEGATGAKGYVYEPYLNAMATPDILFSRYSKGYVLADSYYSASAYLGWQDVVVGDPKMAINHNIQHEHYEGEENDNLSHWHHGHAQNHANNENEGNGNRDEGNTEKSDGGENQRGSDTAGGAGALNAWLLAIFAVITLSRLIKTGNHRRRLACHCGSCVPPCKTPFA